MKKFSKTTVTILTFVISLIFALPVHCADCFRISSVDGGNACVSLRYLEQSDSTTLIYAVLSLPEEPSGAVLVNVNRKLYVTDGEMDYSLLAAHNVPVEDESMIEYTILEGKKHKLNFILEFEKFPADGKFDIVDESSEEEGLNFQGVCVDMSSTKQVDPKRFMNSTRLPVCGLFYDEGHATTYYEKEGVFVSCYSTYSEDIFTLNLTIVNNSNHGILFNTDKFVVTGHKRSGKDSVEVNLPLVSKSEYVHSIAAADRFEAEKASNTHGLAEVSAAVSFASIGTVFRSVEYTGFKVLGAILSDAQNAKVKPYLAELDKTREERTKNYLLSQSIKPGESHIGFIRVKRPKNVKDFVATIHMDDYDFIFCDRITE